MPTTTEQNTSSGIQEGWDTLTSEPNLNALYERIVRSARRNLGDTVRDTTNTMGSWTGGAYNPAHVTGGIPVPVNFPAGDDPDPYISYGSSGELRCGADQRTQRPNISYNPSYSDTVPPPTTPYPVGVSGSLADDCEQTGESHNTEGARLNEFRRTVQGVRNEDSDSGYGSREYVRGLTNGELVNAAKAYEHLRPELWPFNGSRRFDAHERSEWNRMARAVAFLKLEQRRLSGNYGGEYKDLEQEIRRLEFKAIDLRWPRHREQEAADGYEEAAFDPSYGAVAVDPF